MKRLRTRSRASAEDLNDAYTIHESSNLANRPLTHLLLSRVNELLSADRRKDEFLAMLCHELRSPLGAIQNAVSVLNGPAGQDRSEQQRLHALIERQVHHMTRLTADLFDVSGIAHGRLCLQRETIDLRTVLYQAVETITPELERRGHHLSIHCHDGPAWVQGDAARLQQVFRNLLDNACKYTDPGGDLALSLRVHDTFALICVRDSGIGIASNTLPRIFDLFVQADAPTRRPEAGLGIGLALVRTLVEMHGGSVAAVSAGVGQGSEFSVRLPVESSPPPFAA
jgi:two-component system, sensor histidine kinase